MVHDNGKLLAFVALGLCILLVGALAMMQAQNTPTEQSTLDSDSGETRDLEERISKVADSADRWQNVHLLIVFITVIAAAAAFGTQYWTNRKQKVLSSLQTQLNIVKDRQLLEKDRQLAEDLKAKDLAIADANSKASAAEERAGKANARSAEAERRTVEARLELAKFRAPRRLTAEQQARIVESIKQFKGQVYTLAVAPGSEALGLLRDVDAALQAAGWTWRESSGVIQVSGKWGIALTDGVRIQFAPSRESVLAPVVLTLANAINAEGIEGIRAERAKGHELTLPDVVHVMIGTKP